MATVLSDHVRHARPRVLVVDDVPANRMLLRAFLAEVDCDVVFAENGIQALAVVQQEGPDVVLLDVQMPGLDGFAVCRQIKADPATRLLPVVMITALHSTKDRVDALEAGADDFMTKPVERVELVARVRSALRLSSMHDRLDSAERVIFALASAVEARDSYTEAHTQRVANASRELGAQVGLGPDDLDILYRGALLHDIGKIGVPDGILLKPGPLTETELLLMQQHPVIGERIARPLRSATVCLPIIRHHHERWDGEGYPDRLTGDDIPLMARIVAVCDSFDALVSDRPYRQGRSPRAAMQVLEAGAGRQWDPALIAAFVDHLEVSAAQAV